MGRAGCSGPGPPAHGCYIRRQTPEMLVFSRWREQEVHLFGPGLFRLYEKLLGSLHRPLLLQEALLCAYSNNLCLWVISSLCTFICFTRCVYTLHQPRYASQLPIAVRSTHRWKRQYLCFSALTRPLHISFQSLNGFRTPTKMVRNDDIWRSNESWLQIMAVRS